MEIWALRLTYDLLPITINTRIINCLSIPVKGNEITVHSITGRELGTKTKKYHTHSVIYWQGPLTHKNARARLSQEFNLKGNSSYSFTRVDNEDSALSYTIKEGSYHTSDRFELCIRPVSQIEPWVDLALNFDELVKELDSKYMDTDMDDDEYLESYLAICAQCPRRALHLYQIKAHWLALFNARNKLGHQKIYSDPEDMTRYVTVPFNPRKSLVDSIKKFIV